MINKVIHPDNVALREIGEVKKDLMLSPWGFLYIAEKEKPGKYIRDIKEKGWYDLKLPSEKKLKKLIKPIKKRKYADDKGEILDGIRRLAVPIYDINHDLVVSLGIGSIDSHLFDDDKRNKILCFLIKKGQELSEVIK